jgi:hypothetical protein
VHNQTLAKPEPLALYSGVALTWSAGPENGLSEGRGACNNLEICEQY